MRDLIIKTRICIIAKFRAECQQLRPRSSLILTYVTDIYMLFFY